MSDRPLPPEVAERLGPFYVYALVDPRDGATFYVGKGTGRRQADAPPGDGSLWLAELDLLDPHVTESGLEMAATERLAP